MVGSRNEFYQAILILSDESNIRSWTVDQLRKKPRLATKMLDVNLEVRSGKNFTMQNLTLQKLLFIMVIYLSIEILCKLFLTFRD